MTSRRTFPRSDDMYGGGRPSRGLFDHREDGATAAHHVNSVSRRQVNGLGASVDERVSRGKAIVEEDRLGRDVRIPGFTVKQSRDIDQVEASAYGNTERRSTFRDELGTMKMMRSVDAIRGGEAHRYREGGVGGRVERPPYRSEYADESKWLRSGGKHGSLNSYEGVASLRGASSDYVSSTSNSHDILPGFIFESTKRLILDWSLKGSFGLTFDERRLAGKLGPGTKVFLFDGNSRELYGVFQCMRDAVVDLHSEGFSSQIRVRAIKDCLPLLEREFKEIIRDNYYTSTKFAAELSKEQVAKLTQCFRPVDSGRNVPLSLSSSRGSLHSQLVHGRQDFHAVADDFTYGKERRRPPAPETRSFNSQTYHGEDGGRFSSKVPIQVHSSKGFRAETDEHDVANLVLDTSAMAVLSRGKQQLLRGVSGSKVSAPHQVNTGRHSNLRFSDGEWREDDERGDVYRKKHALSSTAADELKKGTRSSSPNWKDAHHPRAEAIGSEVYDRAGKGGYKDATPYVATTRHVRNDIDLNNIPLDMGHGETSSSQIHDVDSKIVRRRVWEDEDEKGFPASPSKGRSVVSRGSDFVVGSNARDEFEDVSPSSQKDHPRIQEKSRPSPVPVPSGFPNVKSVKAVIRPLTRDKPGLSTLLRREAVPSREVVHSSRDFPTRTPNGPLFKIKANLQATPGKGRAERVVTLLSSAKPRPSFNAYKDDDEQQSWKEPNLDSSDEGGLKSDSRKRKASVWSRISLPPTKPLVKKTPLPHGKGRVFSRLGPTVSTFEARDNNIPYKKKKMYTHQNLVWTRKVDGVAGVPQATAESKPTADDVLVEDTTFDTVRDNMEQASGEPHGWSRKKSQLMCNSSGDEGGNVELGEHGKGGRRKIVRPPIGGRVEDTELVERLTGGKPEVDQDPHLHSSVTTASGELNSLWQQGSPAVMMDIEMTTGEAKEGKNEFQESVSASGTRGVHELASNSAVGGTEADSMV